MPGGLPGDVLDGDGASPSPLSRYRDIMGETPRLQCPVFSKSPAVPSSATAQPVLAASPAKQRCWRNDLHPTHTIANKVDSLTPTRSDAGNLTVETKSGLTPVIEADKGAECVTHGQLERTCGRDSILGEKPSIAGHSSRQWVVGLIDGTKNFVWGVLVWVIFIGLIEGGQCVVRLTSTPVLGRYWWAMSGDGA